MTGRTIGRRRAEAEEASGQEVVRPLSDPVKSEGGLAILRGNLAPEGSVVKLAGTERRGQSRARRGSSSPRRIASARSRTSSSSPVT